MLTREQIGKWSVKDETEIEALHIKDTYNKTLTLNSLDSPAADWVTCFRCEDFGQFYLPSLLAALEIQHQKAEIDTLAETIEGADLLRDFTSNVWSCSRCSSGSGWFAGGDYGCVSYGYLYHSGLAVPTIQYFTNEPDDIERLLNDEDGDTEIKPYLFPLSSMSEDQRKYITDRWGINEEFDFEINPDWGEYFVELGDIVDFIDWLNENHFDYRGLIEKGLAIDATGLKIY